MLRYRSLLLFLILSVTACSPAQPTAAPPVWVPPTQAPTPTQAPSATPAPPLATATQPALGAQTGELGWVAYARDGGLWVQSLPNGEAQRITEAGDDARPRPSADGAWLAFRRAGALYVCAPDGSSLTQIADSAGVPFYAWSPGENALLYQSEDGRLLLATFPGPAVEVLFSPGQGPLAGAQLVGWPAWSPDGQRVAFAVQGGQPPAVDYTALWVAAIADPGEISAAYQDPAPQEGNLLLAGWAAGGDGLLFWKQLSFSASLAADGLPLLWVTPGHDQPVNVATTLVEADFWEAAGPAVVVAAGSGRETWTGKQIQVFDLSTQPARVVSPPGLSALSPAVSPDGQRIVFSAGPDLAGSPPDGSALPERSLRLTDLQGQTQRQLTRDPAYRDEHPQWSADGRWLLFARIDAAGSGSLWLLSPWVEGAAPQKIAEGLDLGPYAQDTHGWINWGNLYAWWNGGE
ncbi:MAG: hypothetical protein GYA17_22025 [Chloroflexi bacterium]|nr:hypothetical protein [Chloroflexota bacterium]